MTRAVRSNRAQVITERTPMPVRRPEQQWSLGASERGRAIHELIGELLTSTRNPSRHEIAATVAADELLHGRAVVHGQAIKQHLATAISCYFARFAPCDVWDFAGSSVRVGGCEFDLLWRDSRDGSILADELKTGVFGLLYTRSRLDAQLTRQLAAGRAALGARFVGVRAIVLGRPSASFMAHADGTREAIQWEVI